MPGENQHWVPKFLIKNFADADGRVFSLDVRTDEVTKPPPKYAASNAGFNDFVGGGETISFEDRLEKIETAAAPILKEIVSSRSLAGLTGAQRLRVAEFMAAQSFRTEAFYEGLELKTTRQQFGSIFAELWKGSFLLSAEIARRKWALMVIEHDDIFYLGDHPVVLQHTENPGQRKELSFNIKGVEAFLPLAPRCALYMPCATTSADIMAGYECALAAPEIMRRAQAAGEKEDPDYLNLASRVATQQRPLYLSLTEGSGVIANPGNVENLNYQQCMWAHAAIYSNRRDFAFARRVFRENPQYRSSVKVRLAGYGTEPMMGSAGETSR
jgi:Protein of unknown function (DUF4238)